MRATLIERADGFVGPFYDANNPGMARIGQEQAMVYDSDDMGPFNLLVDERESRRHDTNKLIHNEKQKALPLTKKELAELLMETDLGQGLGKQALLNMRVKDLQEKATALYKNYIEQKCAIYGS
jgi:hypothetical protein